MQTNHLEDVKEAGVLSGLALQEPGSPHARHYPFPGNCNMQKNTSLSILRYLIHIITSGLTDNKTHSLDLITILRVTEQINFRINKKKYFRGGCNFPFIT